MITKLDKDKVKLVEIENDKWAVVIGDYTWGWITKWYDNGGVVNKTGKKFYSAKAIGSHYSYNYFESQDSALSFILNYLKE